MTGKPLAETSWGQTVKAGDPRRCGRYGHICPVYDLALDGGEEARRNTRNPARSHGT